MKIAISCLLAANGVCTTVDDSGAPSSASHTEGKSEVSLSLVPHSGQVMLPVWIDDQGPYDFTMDTGSSIEVCVDERLRTALNLERVGSTDNSDGSGTIVRRDLVAVGRLRLAPDLAFEPPPALVADYGFIGKDGDRAVQGILGFPLFREHLLTIDYGADELRLAQGSLDPEERHTFEFELPDQRPHVTLVVGARTVLALLDTGYAGGVVLPEAWRDQLEFEQDPVVIGRAVGPNGPRGRVWRGRPTEPVEFGPHTLELESVTFFEHRKEALVGRAVLDDYVTTFDQRAGLMRLWPVNDADSAAGG